MAGFSGVSFWPLPYEKMRKSRILQKSLISAKKHEISSFITLRTHVDRCKFNQRHKTNSFYHLKNPQNLPKSDIFAKSWIFAFFHNYEKVRKSRILQKSLISAKKHEISSFITLRTHVDRCKFNQLHKTNSFYHLKNPQNLPKSNIFVKSWIFAFFHMGEVKNWPPKKA